MVVHLFNPRRWEDCEFEASLSYLKTKQKQMIETLEEESVLGVQKTDACRSHQRQKSENEGLR
jgi:hypothetical protein